MRSQEDQPCVRRCSWTSPPLFLQCYCFFPSRSLIAPCANAAHTAGAGRGSRLRSSTLLFFLLIPALDVHLGPDPRAACSPSIPAYSHLQSLLLLCVLLLKLKSSGISARIFFFVFFFLPLKEHLQLLCWFLDLRNFCESNQERNRQLFDYFTHPQPHGSGAVEALGWG